MTGRVVLGEVAGVRCCLIDGGAVNATRGLEFKDDDAPSGEDDNIRTPSPFEWKFIFVDNAPIESFFLCSENESESRGQDAMFFPPRLKLRRGG